MEKYNKESDSEKNMMYVVVCGHVLNLFNFIYLFNLFLPSLFNPPEPSSPPPTLPLVHAHSSFVLSKKKKKKTYLLTLNTILLLKYLNFKIL